MKKNCLLICVLFLSFCLISCQQGNNIEIPDLTLEIPDLSAFENDEETPTYLEGLKNAENNTYSIEYKVNGLRTTIYYMVESNFSKFYNYLSNLDFSYSSKYIPIIYQSVSVCDYAIVITGRNQQSDMYLQYNQYILFFKEKNEVIFIMNHIPYKLNTDRSIVEIWEELVKFGE